MSATVAAVLKKVAVYIATNKKAIKTVVGIILGVLFILLLPILVLLGMFGGEIKFDTERFQELLSEQHMTSTLTDIEEKMTAEGYSQIQIEEAQAIYSFALLSYGNDEDFTDRLVGCFTGEQTTAELIAKVNTEFGTRIVPEEFEDIMHDIKKTEQNA